MTAVVASGTTSKFPTALDTYAGLSVSDNKNFVTASLWGSVVDSVLKLESLFCTTSTVTGGTNLVTDMSSKVVKGLPGHLYKNNWRKAVTLTVPAPTGYMKFPLTLTYPTSSNIIDLVATHTFFTVSASVSATCPLAVLVERSEVTKSDNLIVNGGFETGAVGDVPNGWIAISGTPKIDPGQHGGAQCLTMDSPNETIAQSGIPIIGGEEYTYECWDNAGSSYDADWYTRFTFNTGEKIVLPGTGAPTMKQLVRASVGPNVWVHYTDWFTAPDKATSCKIELYQTNSGKTGDSHYIDDVSLTYYYDKSPKPVNLGNGYSSITLNCILVCQNYGVDSKATIPAGTYYIKGFGSYTSAS